MIIAAGVILLQLSAVMPAKAVAAVKPAVQPVTISETSPTKAIPAALSSVRLTNLNFTAESDSSPAVKTIQPGTAPVPSAITPIRVPQIKPPKHVGIESAEQYPRKTWLMLVVAQHGAAAFDAYSTRYAVGHGAVEQNPLMRPFVHSDSIYAVSQITPTVLDFVSRRMMRSQNGFIRHMWWVPQSVSVGTYLFAGVHNLQVASHQ
ncbi:MAG TPA: hypothetical protein VJQ82_00375 [Terriglobales bacterium]|nr:hypothetical protein [Terriglobales bacterium]